MASPSGCGFSQHGSWLLTGNKLKGRVLRGRVTIEPGSSCVAFCDLPSLKNHVALGENGDICNSVNNTNKKIMQHCFCTSAHFIDWEHVTKPGQDPRGGELDSIFDGSAARSHRTRAYRVGFYCSNLWKIQFAVMYDNEQCLCQL